MGKKLFDPPFDISHLHEGERNRIEQGALYPTEMAKLRNNQNPWPSPQSKKQLSNSEIQPQQKGSDSQSFSAREVRSQPSGSRQNESPLSKGTRVPGQPASESEDERRLRERHEAEAEIVESMHPEDRKKYDDPKTPEAWRKAILETYRDKLDDRKQREEAELRRDVARTAEAQELLRRVKADPTKAHFLLPANDSKEELLKWYEEMRKPVRPIPFPNPPPEYYRRERITQALLLGQRPDPEDIAEEEAEALRNKLKLQQVREQRRNEVEKEFLSPPNLPLSVDENLRAPQDISLQLKDDLHSMGDAVTSPAPNDKPWHKRGDLVVGVVLALGAAVLAIAVILLPPTSARVVMFWLTILFFLLVAAVVLIARYREWTWPRTIVGMFLMLLVVVIFGWFAWPEPKPHTSVEKPQTEAAIPSTSPVAQPSLGSVFFSMFMGKQEDALYKMKPMAFPYQAMGDKNTVDILCRIDMPVHDRPTLSIYVPKTATTETATDAARYAVTHQQQIIDKLLDELKADDRNAIALKARPVSVIRIHLYHEQPFNRSLVMGGPLSIEFFGPRLRV